MPTLTFPTKHLKAVLDGTKNQTQRVSHTLHATKVGAVAVLQFGARTAPTILRTSITQVEVLDYIAFGERLAATGDPRGDMSTEEFHSEIRANGTAEERRLLEVAEQADMSIEDVYAELSEAQQSAVEEYASKKRIDPTALSDEELDALYAKFHKRIVILHFAHPAA